MKYSVKIEGIVRKGVPAPLLLRHPALDLVCPPPIFKIFVFPPLFSVPPPFKVFWTDPPPSCNPFLPQSNQPTFLGLNKYQKGDFTSSTVAFYQKSIFNLLNPFANREINLNLYGIFLGSFLDNFE